jgi:hypothetical protein
MTVTECTTEGYSKSRRSTGVTLARLDGLTPKKRGANVAERKELERLRRDNARLTHRLKQAETIIEFQKKVTELLGSPTEPHEPGSNV